MDLQENIIKWVQLDNRIRKLTDEIKEYKEQRSELTDTINEIAEQQELQHVTIQLNDGTIKFQESRSTGTLSLKYVQQCLSNCINNEEQVDFIMSYIKDNREVKTSRIIKRTIV